MSLTEEFIEEVFARIDGGGRLYFHQSSAAIGFVTTRSQLRFFVWLHYPDSRRRHASLESIPDTKTKCRTQVAQTGNAPQIMYANDLARVAKRWKDLMVVSEESAVIQKSLVG